eukprot:5431473-Prymnesium_polylepis.1
MEFASSRPIVFLSHQWLGSTAPDPRGEQFPRMLQAVEHIARSAPDGPYAAEGVFVWCDYFSIPQDNLPSRRSAISSIAVYVSCCKFFAVIAPTASHAESSGTCDASSYLSRGWCRLEQWAFLAVHGVKRMYLTAGGADAPTPLLQMEGLQAEGLGQLDGSLEGALPLGGAAAWCEWCRESLLVFEGQFSDERDKVRARPPPR